MKLIAIFCAVSLIFFEITCNSITNLISKRGLYKYRADVVADPTDPGDAIIKITADHVILDLEGYCLVQNFSSTTTGFIGIEIATGVQNVIIRNGTVLHVTGNGIKVNDGVENIRFENIIISGCQEGGIFFDGLLTGTGIEKIAIENCSILSCTGAAGGSAYGLHMRAVNNFRVAGCALLDNDAGTSNSGFGCALESSKNGKIFNCSFQDNGGDEQGIGCYISSCTNIIVSNSIAVQNRARSSTVGTVAAGFLVEHSDSVIFKECESLQNNADQQTVVGFSANHGAANIFRKCIAQNNSGATEAVGFRFVGQSNSVIEQSISLANVTLSSGTAYGIYFAGSANDQCYVTANEIVGNNGAVASRGIEDARSSSTSFFRKNHAFNNGTNYAVSYPLTITLPLITGSLSSAIPGLPALSAGDLDNVDVNP